MRKYVATIGFFDGVHIGHKKLIQEVKNISKLNSLKSLIITFDTVAKIEKNLIYPLETKLEILSSFKIDKILLLKFKEIEKLSAEEFFKKFIIKNVSVLVVGEDFKFGRNASGDVKMLGSLCKKYGVYLFIIKDFCVEVNNKIFSISSSLIRQSIVNNNFENVEKFLGREYWIKGKVIKGKGLGKRLGIPTINFLPDKALVLPYGVFLGLARVKKQIFKTVANLGYLPTFKKIFYSKNMDFSCEIHILDLKNKVILQNLKLIEFRPIKKIRKEKEFSSLEELKKQIIKDIEYAKKFFYKSNLKI